MIHVNWRHARGVPDRDNQAVHIIVDLENTAVDIVNEDALPIRVEDLVLQRDEREIPELDSPELALLGVGEFAVAGGHLHWPALVSRDCRVVVAYHRGLIAPC